MSVELIEADQDELSRLVSGRSVDVAVSYAHVPFTGLHTEVLQEIRPHAVVPATHHLASHPGPVSLAELAADPLILLDIPHTGSYYLGLFRAAGLEPAVRFRVSGYETVRGLVARGFGVSVLNQRVRHGRTLSGESVHALTLADDPAPLPIEFVCLPDMLEDPHVIAFRDVCRRLLVPR